MSTLREKARLVASLLWLDWLPHLLLLRLWRRDHHAPKRHARHARHAWRHVRALNAALAVHITNTVGSMWAAYVFAGLALLGFPFDHPSVHDLVQWVSTTFLQLVLLAVIMVGQSVQSAKAEKHQETLLAHIQKLLAQVEALETNHGEMLTDLHSHTRCDGHTTIESVTPKPPVPVRARKTKVAAQG